MRILFFDRRQCVKEKDFQIMFASDAPKRLKSFLGMGVSAGEILFHSSALQLILTIFGFISNNEKVSY